MYENFGELAEGIKKEIEEYSASHKSASNITSLEEMQKIIDSMPEMKSRSNNVNKHVSLMNEISKLITERGLTDSSAIE